MKQKEFISFVIIGFSVLMIIIISLILVWIQFNRFLFWFDVIFIPISFIALIVSAIGYFKDEWNQDDWGIVGIVSLVVLVLTLVTINESYNGGYSNEAIQNKAELLDMLEDYTFILSIYTGEFRLKVEGMVADQFDKVLCEAASGKPCQEVIQKYDAYRDLVGWKEGADKIVNIWR
jgi:hypothetical protein